MPKNNTTQILMLRRKEQDIIRRINERPISEPIPNELRAELDALQEQIYQLQRLGTEPIAIPVPENPPSEVTFTEEKPKKPARKKKDVPVEYPKVDGKAEGSEEEDSSSGRDTKSTDK